jgi:hypothetical protein
LKRTIRDDNTVNFSLRLHVDTAFWVQDAARGKCTPREFVQMIVERAYNEARAERAKGQRPFEEEGS